MLQWQSSGECSSVAKERDCVRMAVESAEGRKANRAQGRAPAMPRNRYGNFHVLPYLCISRAIQARPATIILKRRTWIPKTHK